MKRLVIVVLAALSATAHADMEPFDERPMRRICNGPAAWEQIVSCIKVVEPSATIDSQPSPHTQMVTDGDAKKLYLQREDKKWVLGGQDLHGNDLTERTLVVGSHRVLRVDVRAQQHGAVEIGDLLRVTTIFTCGVPNAELCTSAVRTCEYYRHGRARSTFLGEAAITEAGLAVTGDRSLAAPYCDR